VALGIDKSVKLHDAVERSRLQNVNRTTIERKQNFLLYCLSTMMALSTRALPQWSLDIVKVSPDRLTQKSRHGTFCILRQTFTKVAIRMAKALKWALQLDAVCLELLPHLVSSLTPYLIEKDVGERESFRSLVSFLLTHTTQE